MYTKSNRKSGSLSQKTGCRHISTSSLVPGAPWMLVFAVFWPVWPPCCRWMARNAFCKKTGCEKSTSVANTGTGSGFSHYFGLKGLKSHENDPDLPACRNGWHWSNSRASISFLGSTVGPAIEFKNWKYLQKCPKCREIHYSQNWCKNSSL